MLRQLPIVSFVPRGTNSCLDLAMRYVGAFLPIVLGMWILIAVPSAGTVYLLATLEKIDLRLTLVVIYFTTLPLGILLMNDAVPRLFGQSLQQNLRDTPGARRGVFGVSAALMVLGLGWAFLAENLGDSLGLSASQRTGSIYAGLGLAGFVVLLASLVSVARYQQIDWGTARMFFLCLCLRSLCILGPALALFPPFSDWRLAVVLLLSFLPGIWLALRTGFVIERTCLNRLDSNLVGENIPTLIRDEMGDLFGRASWMTQFGLLLWGLLFITTDAACSLFFRSPVLLGRLASLPSGSETEDYLQFAWELLVHDPFVLATLTATALLVYPINRLAWFFCYVDLRVRKDCWDLELKISHRTFLISQSFSKSEPRKSSS